MEYATIGHVRVSLAGLGCNNFGMRIDEDASRAVVDTALEVGINHFDTADLYGGGRSEEFLGRALGSRRDEAVIGSKFGMAAPPDGLSGGQPEWVARAIDETLTRLGTDHVDIYWLHQPDASTPIGDTLEALDRVVEAGKARVIGCSNFSSAQLDEAAAAAAERGVRPFAAVQNEYSLLHRDPEDDVLPTCERLGLAFVPYFPLASGLLTGKYRRGEPPPPGTRLSKWTKDPDAPMDDERFAAVERLAEYAASRNHTLHELALAWLAGRPSVASVIAGATSPEQVRANAAATTAWELSDADRAAIDAITRPA